MKKKSSDFTLPNSVETEKYVLGAMMLKGGQIVPEVTKVLNTDDFFRPEHKIIYQSIIDITGSGSVPSILTVAEDLKKKKELERVDLLYLTSLPEPVNTFAGINAYIKTIKEKSELRKLIEIGKQITLKSYKEDTEISSIISEASAVISGINEKVAGFKVSRVSEAMRKSFREDTKRRQVYLKRKTGFNNLDSRMVFEPGLYILGATPSAGKTTFCWQLLDQVASLGVPCYYFTFEMATNALLAKTYSRMLYMAEDIHPFSAGAIYNGYWSSALDDVTEIYQLRGEDKLDVVVVEVETRLKVQDFLARLRPLTMNLSEPPVICIDYLQYLETEEETAKLSVDLVLKELKEYQRQTGVTFLVISSLSRMNYYQQIGLESFKESGNIEYAADVVWGMQLEVINSFKAGMSESDKRLKYTEALKAPVRQVEIKCLKNRMGALYDCKFEYQPAHDYFKSIEDGEEVKTNERRTRLG